MKKITFEDLPSTNTPIDSDNLNLLQSNIEEAIEEKQSLPTGGTTGQVLGKNSDADYDVSWINQTGGGSSYDSAPVGAMFDYPSLTPPTGYKICDGSALSRTEYSELFSVIGTTYGSGDGNTTFNLPNRLGRLSIGYKQGDEDFGTLGATGGSKTHTQTVNEMPTHSHSISAYHSMTPQGGGYTGLGNISSPPQLNSKSYMGSTGGGQPMDIMNPYIVSCPIIKVSGTAVLTGNVVDNLDDNSTTNAPSQKAVNNAISATSKLIKEYTVESASNQITIDGLNIEPGKNFKIIINGSSSGDSTDNVNIVCYPNNKSSFSVARVVGLENKIGSINSIANFSTSGLYVGRVIRGSNHFITSDFSWNGTYLKCNSEYGTLASADAYVRGSLTSIVSLSDSTITSLKFQIASGEIAINTKINIYML